MIQRTRLPPSRPPARRARIAAALAGLAVVLAGPAPAQDPAHPIRDRTAARPYAAFVTDLDGAVQSADRQHPVRRFSGLSAGDHLRLGAGARVEVAVPGAQGYVAELRGPGEFAFDGRSIAPVPGSGATAPRARTLSPALQALRLDTGAAVRAGISMRADPQPNPGGPPRPLGVQLPEDVTTLCWPAPPDAANLGPARPGASWAYELRVYDEDGTAVLSTRTDDRCVRWTRPELLLPGRRFVGTVLAGPGPGRVRVLDIAFRIIDADEAARLRAALAQVGQDGPRADRMVVALAFAQRGLADRARALWPGAADGGTFLAQEPVPRWHEP